MLGRVIDESPELRCYSNFQKFIYKSYLAQHRVPHQRTWLTNPKFYTLPLIAQARDILLSQCALNESQKLLCDSIFHYISDRDTITTG